VASAQPTDRSPYPGLRPLDTEDAAVFFGRDAAIVRGLDELRGLQERGVERMLVILGASGAGKSSFLPPVSGPAWSAMTAVSCRYP